MLLQDIHEADQEAPENEVPDDQAALLRFSESPTLILVIKSTVSPKRVLSN